MKPISRLILCFMIAYPGLFASDDHGPVSVRPLITGDLISFQVESEIDLASFDLVISGPGDFYTTLRFEGNHIPFIEGYDTDGAFLPDGQYTYELRPVPRVNHDRTDMADLRENKTRLRGHLKPIAAHSGHFRIQNGLFLVPDLQKLEFTLAANTVRPDGAEPGDPDNGPNSGGNTADNARFDPGSSRDQVIMDDLIVDGSACIGFDCVNGESFGTDTIRMKENNLRIKFEDTSITPGFPSNDWQITANDSHSGGADKFSIEDITGGAIPFTIEGGAPANAIFMNNDGRLGLGTATPGKHIHVLDGNSPTLRLEQDGSEGFAPQTWDIGGNETTFFVHDINHSSLPFRIRDDAPTNALYIDQDGDIGLGTGSPTARLHISDGAALVNDTTTRTGAGVGSFQVTHTAAAATDSHVLMNLEANGQVNFLFKDNADNVTWKQIMNGGAGVASTFTISRDGSGSNEFVLGHSGDLTITGTLTEGSDASRKENFATIDPTEVLSKVIAMPITTWNYLEQEEITHMGPMAQDFYAAFGLGATEKGIANIDSNGVAFGAIQGLHQHLENKDTKIRDLEAQVIALKGQLATQEARLQAIEKLLNQK